MLTEDFIPQQPYNLIKSGTVSWQAPSNIALVKYWGKLAHQIPANPSVSFTLSNCVTTTAVCFTLLEQPSTEFSFELLFHGKIKEDFKPKITSFFKRIEEYMPFLKQYHFEIETSNSFPHSSGIASSASGMAALSMCLLSIEQQLLGKKSDTEYFYKKASFLARLGSGSACRSIKGNIVQWGNHKGITESTDLYGITYPYKIHPVFNSYQDTILLVHKGQKTVSSTVGHNLMNGHPFAEQRFIQAHKNLEQLKEVFQTGDLDAFIGIVESEALTLHAMMMTSEPYFVLMHPNTLNIINIIWTFRKETGIPVCFTLDAGANVHMLYPEEHKEAISQLITKQLVAYCENGQYICDSIGFGSKKL